MIAVWAKSRSKSDLTITVTLGARYYEGIVGSVHAASASKRMDALHKQRGACKHSAEKLPPSDKLPKDSASASEEV